MKSILLANIGNRNLKYEGAFLTKVFSDKSLSGNESFRERTKALLSSLDAGESLEKFDAVIIPEVLKKDRLGIEKVIFFSSDMPEGIRNDQDTIFEGEILCRIFRSQYPTIKFINQPFRAKVFNHDELFNTYRPYLERIRREYAGYKIIYCDAGGTSQQKLAAKISLEYLFKPDQLVIFYVAQNENGKSELMAGESYEYRRIIDMEHIFRAIRSSCYSDAIGLLTDIGIKPDKPKGRLVKFLEFRYRLLQKETLIEAKQLAISQVYSTGFVSDFCKGNAIGDYNQCSELMDEDTFFRLCEILALFKRKFNQGVTEQAIHYFAMFSENYIYSVIKEYYSYDLMGNFYESEGYRLVRDVQNGIIKIENTIIRSDRMGLPLAILVAQTIDDEFNKKILRIIRNCNSIISDYKIPNKAFLGLDYYRNKYAHHGKAVLQKDLEKQPYYSDLWEIFNLFGMPKKCIYEKMNEEVIELLKV